MPIAARAVDDPTPLEETLHQAGMALLCCHLTVLTRADRSPWLLGLVSVRDVGLRGSPGSGAAVCRAAAPLTVRLVIPWMTSLVPRGSRRPARPAWGAPSSAPR